MNVRLSHLRSVAIYLAVATAAAGLLIIAGWQFRIPLLKGEAFGTFVAPNTAASFLCSALSILLQMRSRRGWQYAGLVLAGAVTVFAALTAAEYVFRIDLGIDRVLMAHRLSDWNLPLVGRYSVNSAFGFTFAGISLLTLRRQSGSPVSEFFAGLVVLVSYLSLIARLYGASYLYDNVMAVHTAVLFGLLGLALLLAASREALLGILLSPFAGAIASRNMIAAILVLLPTLGGVELWAESKARVSLNFGTALSVVIATTVFTLLALRTAAVLNDTDRQRVATEEALLRSRQIEAAGRMAASVAHEINNPLEAVGNIIYLLKNVPIPAEEKERYLEVAEAELNRVAALARRTLGFYKEDAQAVPVAVRPMIDSVLDVYRTKLPAHASVCRNVPENTFVLAKPGEIRQVMSNLIANAIDALPIKDGTLQIEVTEANGRVAIVIRDNGHGIAPENLDRIFEPFFTTKAERGTGLGLWVSKNLIAKNGGTVRVSSSQDKGNSGTVFQLAFPAAHPAEPAKEQAIKQAATKSA